MLRLVKPDESGQFEESYYAQNYRNYELQNPDRKLAFYRSVLERHWNTSHPRRVHDIGCAFGRFLGFLQGWDAYGSDTSPFAIKKAQQLVPKGTFAVDSAKSGSIFQTTFGAVTAFDVLEHVPDLDGLARHVHKELVPGGLFLFVVPVYDGLSGSVIRRLDKDPTHVHKWARAGWLEWAEKHFTVIEWTGILRYLLPAGYYLHYPTKLFRNHTPAILVACRRP